MIYSIANSLYLGNRDVNALAGLAAAEPFENICPTIGWLFQVGLQSQVARLLAQNKTERIRRLFLFSLLIAFSVTSLLAGLVLGFLEPLLDFVGIHSGRVADFAMDYIRPLLWAAPAIVLYYFFAGFSFGLGKIKLVTYLSLLPMLTGVCLFSPLFIIVFDLKCTGAAAAVVVSYSVPCCVYFVHFAFFDRIINPFSLVKRHSSIENNKRTLSDTLEVIKIGASDFALSFGWTITIASGYYCLTTIAQEAGTNEDVSACWGVVSRLRSISFTTAIGLNSGVLSVSSFAQGEKDGTRFWKFHQANFICCLVACWAFTIVMMAFAPDILRLFGIHSAIGIELGSGMMRFASIGVAFTFVEWCVQTLFQALELSGLALIMSIFSFIAYPASFFIFYAIGTACFKKPDEQIMMLMAGWSASDLFSTIVSSVFWISNRKKLKQYFIKTEQ